jgi:hypothetical protein
MTGGLRDGEVREEREVLGGLGERGCVTLRISEFEPSERAELNHEYVPLLMLRDGTVDRSVTPRP